MREVARARIEAEKQDEKKDNSELVLLSTLRCCSGRKNSLGQNVGGTEKQIELRNALIESKWLVDLSETPLSSIAHKISPILDLKCWTTSDQCEPRMKELLIVLYVQVALRVL